ncbi:Colicin I receptor precursor [Prosthecochloris sp. CIB 2401]|nr:Colicin I receptor precursor [Prosthecochloris sp. CIB 2401]
MIRLTTGQPEKAGNNGENKMKSAFPRKSITRALAVVLAGVALGDASAAGPESAALDKIVVSATKTPHTLGDVPVAAEVITREELEARNVQTLQEALEQQTGLIVESNSSGWGDKGKMSIHGMDQRHTLVLVDGQRVLGGHQDGIDLQQISIGMVERIEILRGPASALYGSDAMGGVINIITRPAAEKPGFSGTLTLGSRSTTIGEVSASGGSEKVRTCINYTYRESDGVDKEFDIYEEHILQGTVSLDLSERVDIDLKPYYSFHDMEEQERRQERFGLNALVGWRPDDVSSWSFRGSVFDYNQWTLDRATDYNLSDYEVEAGYSRVLGDTHLMTAGYQLWSQERDDEGKNMQIDQVLHSFYVQDEIDLSPVVLVLGGRFDMHDDWGEEFNPRVAIKYGVSDDLTLRASVGTAFKAPSLLKLYGDWMMGPYVVYANPDLEPETSIGYQAGVQYRVSEAVSVSASLFRNEIENLIATRIVKMGRPPWGMYWENADEAVTQGIEMNVAARITDDMDMRVGYTYLDTEDKLTGNELAYKPAHRVVSGLDIQLPADARIHLEANYTGERWEDEENTVNLDDYWMCNVGVSKKIGQHAAVFVKVNNVFGEKNIVDEYDIDGTEYLAGIKMSI